MNRKVVLEIFAIKVGRKCGPPPDGHRSRSCARTIQYNLHQTLSEDLTFADVGNVWQYLNTVCIEKDEVDSYGRLARVTHIAVAMVTL